MCACSSLGNCLNCRHSCLCKIRWSHMCKRHPSPPRQWSHALPSTSARDSSKPSLDPCPSEGLARCVDRPLLGHTHTHTHTADSHWRLKPPTGTYMNNSHVPACLGSHTTNKTSNHDTWTLHTCFPPQTGPLNHATCHPNTEVPKVATFNNKTKINPAPRKPAWVLPNFPFETKCPR